MLDTMLHKGGELATDMKRGAHMAVDKIGKTTGTTINKIGDVVDGVTGGVLKEGVRGARALKEGLKKGVQHQIKMGMGLDYMDPSKKREGELDELGVVLTLQDENEQELLVGIDNARGRGGQRLITLFAQFWFVNATTFKLRYKQNLEANN